ncbi:type IV secretion system protein [Salmonella enterica subsp. enterica serovar Wichita]|nr:type IV secretion system protein [Salmonella enterica subsp. enterica serovar Wichita]
MSGIFVGMNNTIMDGLNVALAGQTSVYSTMIDIITISSFTAFIMWRGYQTLGGKLQQPLEEVVWDTGRMLLIMMFVLNRGGWLDITISALNGLKDGFSGSDNVWQVLDTLWEKSQELGTILYKMDESTYVKLQGGLAEFLVWAGTIFILIVATIVNELAEITILLMSTTAPIFIFCLLYGFLKPMFDNWFKTIITAILTIMFSALFLRIVINYISTILVEASKVAQESNMVTIAAQVLLACVGSGVLIWFAAKISQVLGGAATQATMQAVAKTGIMSAGSAAGSATKAVAPYALAAGKGAAQAAGHGIDYAASKAGAAFTSAGNTLAMWSIRAESIRNMQRLNKL